MANRPHRAVPPPQAPSRAPPAPVPPTPRHLPNRHRTRSLASTRRPDTGHAPCRVQRRPRRVQRRGSLLAVSAADSLSVYSLRSLSVRAGGSSTRATHPALLGCSTASRSRVRLTSNDPVGSPTTSIPSNGQGLAGSFAADGCVSPLMRPGVRWRVGVWIPASLPRPPSPRLLMCMHYCAAVVLV